MENMVLAALAGFFSVAVDELENLLISHEL
jgi:uncharacterized membrane protein